MGSYLGPEFVPQGRNVIPQGPSGVGKTHLAVAVAYKAIQYGADARFVTCDQLVDDLSKGHSRRAPERKGPEFREPTPRFESHTTTRYWRMPVGAISMFQLVVEGSMW